MHLVHVFFSAVVGEVGDEDGQLEWVDEALKSVRDGQKVLLVIHDQQHSLLQQQGREGAHDIVGFHPLNQPIVVGHVHVREVGYFRQGELPLIEASAAQLACARARDLEDHREHVLLESPLVKPFLLLFKEPLQNFPEEIVKVVA